MLLMIVCGWHKSNAQYQAGLEQYYSMHNKTVSFTPMGWYQSATGLYVEGRYNYEAANTFSLYAGKTFEKKSTISYAVSTMLGIVAGEFKGGGIAVNADAEYKKLSLSLQSQYTFSIKHPTNNFIYVWSDISYQATHWLSAGLSLQQTNVYNEKGISEKGIFAKVKSGNWSFPLYMFNPLCNKRHAMLGINLAWDNK